MGSLPNGRATDLSCDWRSAKSPHRPGQKEAVLISCAGLLGLTAFTVGRRIKEIGIRKVLGASTARVIFLLAREYLIIVLAANIIAWPIAYYAMGRWLRNFAYRIQLGVLTFILAGTLAFGITLLTVSLQAARTNPVDCLRYE